MNLVRNGRLTFTLVAGLAILTGCTSTSPPSGEDQTKIDELQASLEQCEGDLAKAREQFENVSKSYATIAPDIIKDLEEEQQKILAMVPAVVQGEVSQRLERYAEMVANRVSGLAGQMETLRASYDSQSQENARLTEQLEKLGASVASNSADTGTRLDTLVEDSQTVRQRWKNLATGMAKELRGFDRRLTCKGCDDRIKVKAASGREITHFHETIASRLETLAGSI